MLALDRSAQSANVCIVQFALFIVGVACYIRLKHTYSTVAGIPEDGSTSTPASSPEKAFPGGEKLATTLADGGATGHGDLEELQASTTRLAPKSLIIWASIMFVINLAAWYLTSVVWPSASEGKISLWQFTFLLLLATSPVSAAVHVLFCALSLSRRNGIDERKTESYFALMRSGMLDGAILSPVFVVYVAYTYPETVLNYRAVAWIAGSLHASQSAVWAHFFRLSLQESQDRAAARVVV
ncbi:hypothetical protein AURDEDRAFT_171602 [Auricularia subglabra TFB-10046 SS5]|nr:hypothetical protein AURDEDRAFT_171602 [Auricularia subglabra TFB-10046 SS5]